MEMYRCSCGRDFLDHGLLGYHLMNNPHEHMYSRSEVEAIVLAERERILTDVLVFKADGAWAATYRKECGSVDLDALLASAKGGEALGPEPSSSRNWANVNEAGAGTVGLTGTGDRPVSAPDLSPVHGHGYPVVGGIPDQPDVTPVPAPASSSLPHVHVYEYDGAFRCFDCKSQWGALPGHPTMPSECISPQAAEPVERSSIPTPDEHGERHGHHPTGGRNRCYTCYAIGWEENKPKVEREALIDAARNLREWAISGGPKEKPFWGAEMTMLHLAADRIEAMAKEVGE